MPDDILATALWAALLASVILTPLGLARHSWPRLLSAALLSLAFSIAAAFNIGLLTLLLTCLQVAAAVALGRSARWRGWTGLLILAFAAWALAVPIPLYLEPPTPWLPVISLAMLIAGFALAIIGPTRRRATAPNGLG